MDDNENLGPDERPVSKGLDKKTLLIGAMFVLALGLLVALNMK